MRFHSDTLTEDDYYTTLAITGIDRVWIDECSERSSRSRSKAFEIRLAAEHCKGRRRRNSGRYGAEGGEVWAATFDEHGKWMAELYKLDPNMIVSGCYKDVQEFNERTNNAYLPIEKTNIKIA